MKFSVVSSAFLFGAIVLANADFYRDLRRAFKDFDFEENGEDNFGQDQEDSELSEDDSEDLKEVDKRADKDFVNVALDMHNKYRAEHGSPPLKIDDQLNKDAQAYAEEICKTNVNRHSCSPCDKYGENLAFKAATNPPTGTEAAKWAVQQWYDEVKDYPFGNPGGGDHNKWGHFTSVIWKSTMKMGIGIATGTKLGKSGNPMGTVCIVARYLPAGNVFTPEDMKANVLPKGG